MSIYRTEEGKRKILALYDHQLERLGVPYSDIYVDTSFGKTHIVETGDPQGIPLLLFHGGNSTTAYTLLTCGFLMSDFRIFAVDTIGHPGKSAEVSLSAKNYDYGKWAGEVIDMLGFESIRCFGGSFGAGILAKTMCAAPGKVKRAVLYIPSGINNAPAINSMGMMFPMIMFQLTRRDKWLRKTMLPIALTEDNIDDDMLETAKLSIEYTKVKSAMPSNVSEKLILKCKAPALVMAAEKDCLFPARRVIPRAKRIIPDCRAYLLKGRGHVNELTEREKRLIVGFLKKQ